MRSVFRALLFGSLLVASSCFASACGGSDTPPAEAAPPMTAEAQRFVQDETSAFLVLGLPDMRAAAYEEAAPLWDSGVTRRMHEGNQIVLDFLRESWMSLSAFYPAEHFDGETPRGYLDAYVTERSDTHMQALADDGTAGTMQGVMVGSELIADLEARIEEMVADIAEVMDFGARSGTPGYDLDAWTEEWTREVGDEIID